MFGTKEEMKEHADGRIDDLKSRGFANAGLYDPPGVGGTHVMYVLHHADKPEIYAGLPNNPRISPVVEAVEGRHQICRPAVIGLTAAVGFLHHVVAGPNRVSARGRGEAPRADRKASRHERYDVEPGDRSIRRNPGHGRPLHGGARINHWITAASLVLLALSGLALFHPSLFFLTGLFGGGPVDARLHPWIGVVLFFGFLGLFLRFWRANLGERATATWLARSRDVLTGHEENLPEVGKYNAGQKFVFWIDVAPDHRA